MAASAREQTAVQNAVEHDTNRPPSITHRNSIIGRAVMIRSAADDDAAAHAARLRTRVEQRERLRPSTSLSVAALTLSERLRYTIQQTELCSHATADSSMRRRGATAPACRARAHATKRAHAARCTVPIIIPRQPEASSIRSTRTAPSNGSNAARQATCRRVGHRRSLTPADASRHVAADAS